MTEDPTNRPRDKDSLDERDLVDLDERELGEPVAELAALREEPAPQRLLGGVHNSIQRRAFASQIINLGMPVFLKTALEYVSMVFSAFESGKKAKKQEDTQ